MHHLNSHQSKVAYDLALVVLLATLASLIAGIFTKYDVPF